MQRACMGPELTTLLRNTGTGIDTVREFSLKGELIDVRPHRSSPHFVVS